jgi:hypothetical protein
MVKGKKLKKGDIAKFPGGQDSMFCFIENTWNEAIINQIDSGNISVSLKIDKTGKIDSIVCEPFNIKKTDPNFIGVNDEKLKVEILKVIKKMPDWEPKIKKRKPEESWRNIILVFPYNQKCK